MSYREIAPPPHLAEAVECFWVGRSAGTPSAPHRVVPDGCADILFKCGGGEPTLTAVGPMTRFADFVLFAEQTLVGIRFRPGMWPSQLRIRGNEITDQIVPLEDLWGRQARCLLEQLENAESAEACTAKLAEAVQADRRSGFQRTVGWMEARHGLVSLDDAARHAGLSTRQFRRVCLAETGLSPKFLAQVLRFRHALSRVQAERGQHAGLAAECGYADQSHLITEFRRFCGETPASLVSHRLE